MKKLIVILTILSFYTSLAQKMPSDYFNEADKYLEEKKYDKALLCYQYIVENHPKNELYPRAYYNVGYVYFLQNDYNNAIPIFKNILVSNFNENDNAGGGIMADPYTNYKHRSSKILSDIYFDKQIFDSALYYLSLADTLYPYLHFCGNEYASNNIKTVLRYSEIYQKLNNPDKAIETLLPTVFANLADNSKVIDELKKLLANKNKIKKKLDESLNKIYSKKIKKDDYSYTSYYFNFLNTEIYIPDNFIEDNQKFNKNKAIKAIYKTDFYKMIEKL